MTDFPSWWREDEGKPPVLFHTELSVPKGWTHVPGRYDVQTGQWIEEARPADDIKPLRAAYKEKFGKRPFNGWTADELRSKLA